MSRLSRLASALLVPLVILAAAPMLDAQTCAAGTRAALVFDGVDDYVKVPVHPALDGFANFTFEMWFRANPTGPTFRCLLDKGASFPYLLGAYSQLTVFLEGNQVIQSPGTVLDNTWHHFAVTASGNNLTMYLDGNPISVGTYMAPLSSSIADLYIGADYGGGPFYDHWSGAIDDIRIWNVARTGVQINANRLYVLSGNEPGLVAYYRFDATSGQTIVNSASGLGAALNGTLGPDANLTAEDPTYSTTDVPPMLYCSNGPGQPNSTAARLQVNGLGTGTAPGPFNVSVTAGNNITLVWTGPPNAPLVLAAGPLNTNSFNFGCVGKLDIGTPPLYSDVGFVMDGQNFPGSFLYVLSSTGSSSQVYSIPQSVVGLSMTIQGIVIQPGGSPCPLVLTAAFPITVM